MDKNTIICLMGSWLPLFLSMAVQAQPAPEWNLVAVDEASDSARRVHFDPGTKFHTFTAKGGAKETIAYGNPLVLSYGGMNPEAQYKMRFTFVTDVGRSQKVAIDGNPLLQKFLIQPVAPKIIECELPKLAFMYGEMHLSIECVGGPNAVVSKVEMFSTDRAALKTAMPKQKQGAAEFSAVVTADDLSKVLPVLTPRPVGPVTELSGTWKFSPVALDGFEKAAAHDDWKGIAVPGEWVMQGFLVDPGTPAAYFRAFDLASKPAGQRVKLRFSSVHSLCKVFVNGQPVGAHEGGFVPFECDITDAVKAGANTLALAVTSESMLDDLACGSQYAAHPLGGINRKVELFTVPEVHISNVKVETVFDEKFVNATLIARVAVRNESDKAVSGMGLSCAVAGAVGEAILPEIPAGKTVSTVLKLDVKNPARWDSEHPNLHRLTLVFNGSQVAETVGFRQIEVKGNQVFVNGSAIKLRGVCRHEVHPLLGRALNDALWKADAKIYREMNCNFIRTSHYPPSEEFLAECDRLGLFVELEAPICWLGHGASDVFKPGYKPTLAIFDRVLLANLESIQGYPNNPSVIMRSLANESGWNALFNRVHQFARLADSTRPFTFHDQCWGGFNNHGSGSMPIGNYHYPGMDGPAAADKESRPIQFGEYCHLNTYNRREIVTDPGVRDYYGVAIHPMWELMVHARGNLGGSIWSGIDDVFLLPDDRAVGYGEWGPIDGWRRLKPEAWHIKKSFSPVRVLGTKTSGREPVVEVENRLIFSDLSEIKVEWALADFATNSSNAKLNALAVNLAPGKKGLFAIPAVSQDRIYLRFSTRDGLMLDEELLQINPAAAVVDTAKALAASAKLTTREVAGKIDIIGDTFRWQVDRATGRIVQGVVNGSVVLTDGPALMMLPLTSGACSTSHSKDIQPLNDPCTQWRVKSVKSESVASAVKIIVEGEYAEAAGSYTMTFGADGSLKLDYAFTSRIELNPRQWGMVFTAPAVQSRIAWSRDSYWTTYPEGHIGRPVGTASAELKGRDSFLSRTPPTWAWEQDENALGSADFRSTRAKIRWFRLDDPASGNGLRVESEGQQSVRAWRSGDSAIGLLVAGFNTGGGDGFLAGAHYGHEFRPIKKNGIIKDGILVRLIQKP